MIEVNFGFSERTTCEDTSSQEFFMTNYDDFKMMYELFWGHKLDKTPRELSVSLCRSYGCEDCPLRWRCHDDGFTFYDWMMKSKE